MTAGRESISETKDWRTPPEYVDAVRRVFITGIGLDPCSNAHSTVGADVNIAPPRDGLAMPWDAPTVYVNPPYGRDRIRGTTIRDWLAKCSEAASTGSQVLALVPVATNTRHWRDHVFTATSICFLKVARLKFVLDERPLPKARRWRARWYTGATPAPAPSGSGRCSASSAPCCGVRGLDRATRPILFPSARGG